MTTEDLEFARDHAMHRDGIDGGPRGEQPHLHVAAAWPQTLD